MPVYPVTLSPVYFVGLLPRLSPPLVLVCRDVDFSTGSFELPPSLRLPLNLPPSTITSRATHALLSSSNHRDESLDNPLFLSCLAPPRSWQSSVMTLRCFAAPSSCQLCLYPRRGRLLAAWSLTATPTALTPPLFVRRRLQLDCLFQAEPASVHPASRPGKAQPSRNHDQAVATFVGVFLS